MTASRRRWLRIGLILLAINQGVPGLWAALGPSSFYSDFPLPSHPWVAMLPPYNEHFIRDLGTLSVSVAIVLVAAAIYLDHVLVNVALLASAVFAVPHMFFHLNHLEPFGIGDIVAQTVVVVLSAALPVGLLAWNLLPVRQVEIV